jgi:hypothetical protein
VLGDLLGVIGDDSGARRPGGRAVDHRLVLSTAGVDR